MTVSIITHADCVLHEMGAHHPECPARLVAIQDQLQSSNLEFEWLADAPLASREQLCYAHDPEYVDSIFSKAPTEGQIWLDPDTSMNPHSLPAALRAAGAVISAVDMVMAGKSTAAFCNVRPPGHHAESDKAMGFCFFNSIAVGAAHALQKYKLKRVAIVDFDVHHGNGTEDIFRNNPEVLFCSTFQHPFFPHSGTDVVANNVINIPLAAGTDGQAFRLAIETHWLPRLRAFQPEIIFISAGFDAHAEDEMADFNLLDDDFAWVSSEIKKIADKFAKGRIVSALEGGYSLPALGGSVLAHLSALQDSK